MKRSKSASLVKFFLIFVIFLGIILRFINLEQKVYWIDEVFTSVQVSGHLQQEVKNDIINGKTIGFEDIKKYQYPSLDLSKTAIDVVKGLISLEPQHTPIYFVLARYWHQLFGNSIFVIRSLSAISGILCLPLIYFLTMELFNKQLISLFATALFSISPFFLIISQEARPFSLWSLMILLSSFFLIKLQRNPSLKNGLLYSISLTISFYTFIFTALVWCSHLSYIYFSEKRLTNRNSLLFLVSSSIAFLLFMPWIIILFNFREKLKNFASVPTNFSDFIKGYLLNSGRLFIDFGITKDSPKFFLSITIVASLVLVILYIYSLLYFVSSCPGKTQLFVIVLFSVSIGIPLVVDIVKGSQYSLVSRYLIPWFISIIIIVAYTLASKVDGQSYRWLWSLMTILILTLSIISNIYYLSSEKWRTKVPSNSNVDLAPIINQSSNPLVVSDAFFIKVFSLSHQLNSNTEYQLMVEPADPAWREFKIEKVGHDKIFLYTPSNKLINLLRTQGEVTQLLVTDDHQASLWSFK